ncbi:MAG: hypothetical protein ACLR6B_05585 [Blautia sp.]
MVEQGHAVVQTPHCGSNTKTRRTIGCHQIRHTILRQISEAEGIGHAGVRLSAQKLCQLKIRQLSHEFIQRGTTFRHIDEHDLFTASCPQSL